MKLDGIEVVGIIPNLSEINSPTVNFSNSMISIGGPNGSGKSEFLRRIKAGFSGDISELDPDTQIGIVIKVVSPKDDLDKEKSPLQDDRFIQNFYAGAMENLNWRIFKSHLEDNPRYIEEFELGMASVLAVSIKANFHEQLKESMEIFNKHASKVHNEKDSLSAEEISKIERYVSVLNFVKEKILENDEFVNDFASDFLKSYEILLVPVGTHDRPEWNAYLINRFISEDVNYVSAILHINSPKTNLFLENPERSINLSVKREIGVALSSRHDSNPWLLVNVGRIQAAGFVIIDPDDSSIANMRMALNSSVSSIFDWNKIGTSLSPQIDLEKNKMKAIKGMQELMKSLDSPRNPKIGSVLDVKFLITTKDGNIEVNSEVFDWLENQSKIVNSITKGFLPNMPEIKLVLNNPSSWTKNGIFDFAVILSPIDLPLESLSPTQQRWVKFVLSFSLFSYNDRRIIILDEPELGLQRKLEKSIFEVLDLFAVDNLVLVSSHSSIFLQAPQVIGIKVKEDSTRLYSSYFGSLYSHLHDFDIAEAEYFDSFNLIVVTEGARDKAMLEGFAGEILEANKILIVAGNGIKSWEGFFSSHILPMLTTPKIVFLVDGFQPDRMNASVIESKKLVHKGHPAVKFHFLRSIPMWSDGAALGKKIMESFAESLTRAVISKDADRIFFEATGDRDCIEWLPVESFPLKEKSWDAVWKEAEKMKDQDNALTGEDFKRYLKDQIKLVNPRLNIEPETLKEIAAMTKIQGKTPKRIRKLIDRLVLLAN